MPAINLKQNTSFTFQRPLIPLFMPDFARKQVSERDKQVDAHTVFLKTILDLFLKCRRLAITIVENKWHCRGG